ncbi:MAG: M48 family metalloprotease [Prevotellaceae bacterium]|jgi:predicted Zn-dependent protease|nr:M48 family metalloprotease [Prevotellaceae bacterium]
MGCTTISNVANALVSFNPTDISTDKELRTQMYAQIASDQTNYPLLDETKYADAYKHIRRIAVTILDCGVVENRDVFDWSVMIIDADDVQNAFACPGGKLYVYTGLIKYIDNEAQLAGVMAHEIAHAAARHSSRQIFQNGSRLVKR